jgi:hypothetical protein
VRPISLEVEYEAFPHTGGTELWATITVRDPRGISWRLAATGVETLLRGGLLGPAMTRIAAAAASPVTPAGSLTCG